MTEEIRRPVITPVALVKSRKQEFLDSTCHIPLGAPVIFSGRGGEGKSTYALHIAAQVSQGTLDGRYLGQPRNVLIISHEDDPASQIKPRLQAAGANLNNVCLFEVSSTYDGLETRGIPNLAKDMTLIQETITELEPALVIIDPLISTMDGDSHKQDDVRRALNPLATLTQENGLAVICIMHTNKSRGARADRTSGSHAFRDIARALTLFAHDEETGNRILTLDKSSYSMNEGNSYAFRLVPTDVNTDDGETTNVARVEWLGESVQSVQDAWNAELGEESDGNETAAWLMAFMKSQGGHAKSADIKKAATLDGLNWRTVQRHGSKLCHKASSGFRGEWSWTLKGDKDDKDDSTHTRDIYDIPVTSMGANVLTCRVCNEPMSEVHAAIGTHPTCDPEGVPNA